MGGHGTTVDAGHVKGHVPRMAEVDGVGERRPPGGGDEALPDDVRLQKLQEDGRPPRVQFSERVVEQENGVRVEPGLQIQILRKLQRHPEGSVLSL